MEWQCVDTCGPRPLYIDQVIFWQEFVPKLKCDIWDRSIRISYVLPSYFFLSILIHVETHDMPFEKNSSCEYLGYDCISFNEASSWWWKTYLWTWFFHLNVSFKVLHRCFSGPRCRLGNLCTNKNFQQKNYQKVDLFYSPKKGHGLKAGQDMERFVPSLYPLAFYFICWIFVIFWVIDASVLTLYFMQCFYAII